MKPLRMVEAAFRAVSALFLLAWLLALFGCRAAHVVLFLSWPVVAGLALVVAVRRSP